MSMREYKYNPFGGVDSSYHPDLTYGGDKEKKNPWVMVGKIAALIVLSVIILTVTVSFITVNKYKKDADDIITDFNRANQTLHMNVTNPDFANDYREGAKYAKEQGINDVAEILGAVSNLIDSLHAKPVDINTDMSNDEAVEIVGPYFALCDLIDAAPSEKTVNAGSLCTTYSATARQMIEKVNSYNNIVSSPMGWFAPGAELYPDVTGTTNE